LKNLKQSFRTKGGFVSAHWDGTSATEEKIKDLTKATIRCIPLIELKRLEVAFYGGKISKKSVVCKAY
jgi:prolyl-tRNA synthetase